MISLLVASLCSSVVGQGNPACMNAMRATFIESGVDKKINNAERYLYQKVQNIGPNETATTYLAVAYRISVTKSLSYSISNFMTCDRVNVDINRAGASMGFEWKF